MNKRHDFFRRLLSGCRFYAFFCLLFLAGCSPELTEPEPVPVPDPDVEVPELPTLLCKPFVTGGYTDQVSYLPGDKARVYFQSTRGSELCRIDVFDLAGDSVFSTSSIIPIATGFPTDASENGYRYPVAAEFSVPALQSGMYLIENRIPFIIKTDEPVDALVIYPSNTANAYAESGGKSLYSRQERPPKVSFHRPIPLESLSEVCLKWFTQLEDFTFGYIADSDMDFYENIAKAKVLVIAGHSEYWTRQARLNFDRFVDGGGHALVLSGNTMWWQVRYTEDGSGLICYKDDSLDPIADPLLRTINWHEAKLEYPILSSIGAHFPLGGYGKQNDKGWNGYKIPSPLSPLFDGLNLIRGDIISLPTLEYDGAPITGYDAEGFPVLDTDALGFEKVELLGFDLGFRVVETTATFMIFRKTASSGIIINTASTDWCSSYGMGGPSGNAIKRITHNALYKLVHDLPGFSDDEGS